MALGTCGVMTTMLDLSLELDSLFVHPRLEFTQNTACFS